MGSHLPLYSFASCRFPLLLIAKTHHLQVNDDLAERLAATNLDTSDTAESNVNVDKEALDNGNKTPEQQPSVCCASFLLSIICWVSYNQMGLS